MKVCDWGHDEIVFDGRKCPLCDANKEIERLEVDITMLEKKINDKEE